MTKKYQLKIAVLSLSALTFVSSCKKDEKPAATGDLMTFTGRIGNGGAKTEVNGFEMTWSDGDSIVINGKEFSSTLTSDHKTATFTGEFLMPPYEAYYPASLYKDDKYVLPSTQTYNKNDLSEVSPMYAKSNTSDLQFYNICAMVKLSVKGEGTVKKITVSANKGGNPALLSGAFNIQGNASDGYYAEINSNGGSESLTLDCGGVTLSKTTATTFYVVLPQGEYTDLKFTLTGRSSLTWSSSPVTGNLNASKMYSKELVGTSVVKPETLSGVFSVSADKEVQFSRGNLQAKYNGTGYDWGFAEEQWDYVGNAAGNTTIKGDGTNNDNTVVDLFGWSTSATNYGINSSEDYSTYSGAFQDWGKVFGSTWRTLSSDEWTYLFNTRTVNGDTGEGHSYQRATINKDTPEDVGVYGMIVYPNGYASETKTSYTSAEWATAESVGCVFLPAAGSRRGTSVYDVGSNGLYWDSSSNFDDSAYGLNFNSGFVTLTDTYYRRAGSSVRLVRSVGVVEN